MKLYVTLTSPYARIVRVLIIEKGMEDRVAVEQVATRTPDSPLLAINPSGRVPTLVDDDGTVFEDSPLICAWLDAIGGAPSLLSQGWEARRREARVRSMLDGIAVWSREAWRPADEQSPTIVAHEAARAGRMTRMFEAEIAAGAFALAADAPPDLAQITLGCALHGREDRPSGFDWRTGNPSLAAWIDAFGARESMQRTLPPEI